MKENLPKIHETQNEPSGLGEPGSLPKRSEVYDWIQCVVAALVFCVLLFSFFVRLVDVIGSSMYPTLEDADKIVISRLFYTPEQGDIVVFRKGSFKDEPLVKRIIAVAGQTVDIDFENGIVYVDGEILDEPYIAELTKEREDFYGPVTVPEGCIFVMGDNRMKSNDSRDERIGFVDERSIMGKVYVTVFPLKNFGSVYRN
ncbi:MAG TPA: signal peptidase I [Clostridiales bacterium]|jgi:signal peptidase I|nr:signal peptidase I [Clostridiales bacterium]HBR08227.1 signal peptidase I [Clostridiales bacterium]